MTKEEALKYVYEVIGDYYHLYHDDEAGMLLGDIDPWYIIAKGAKTADPAAWHDWLDAINKVTLEDNLSEEEAQKAMLVLMKEYTNHHGFNLKKAISYFSK
jgi:hypothetical protein